MQHKIIYTLSVDFGAMQFALDIHHPPTKAYACGWIEHCDPLDEEDSRYCSISYPDAKHPELTKSLFWKIVCDALPRSRHDQTGLHVLLRVTAIDEAGHEINAMTFEDGYDPDWDSRRPEYTGGTFRYNGRAFSAELQRKLDRIAAIVHGDDHA